MSTTTEERTQPRLKQRYRDEIVGQLREEFDFPNVMQVPRLTKIVVNMASATRPGTASSLTAPSAT